MHCSIQLLVTGIIFLLKASHISVTDSSCYSRASHTHGTYYYNKGIGYY